MLTSRDGIEIKPGQVWKASDVAHERPPAWWRIEAQADFGWVARTIPEEQAGLPWDGIRSATGTCTIGYESNGRTGLRRTVWTLINPQVTFYLE